MRKTLTYGAPAPRLMSTALVTFYVAIRHTAPNRGKGQTNGEKHKHRCADIDHRSLLLLVGTRIMHGGNFKGMT
jgi:hypothetical protein